jgi:hypothetical protein
VIDGSSINDRKAVLEIWFHHFSYTLLYILALFFRNAWQIYHTLDDSHGNTGLICDSIQCMLEIPYDVYQVSSAA